MCTKRLVYNILYKYDITVDHEQFTVGSLGLAGTYTLSINAILYIYVLQMHKEFSHNGEVVDFKFLHEN